jgi:hypothetical protein
MNSDEQAEHRNCAGRVRGMHRYHMEEKGWLDIAYGHVVCRHGYVFAGRGFGVRSAANGTKAANDRYFAVCFLGDDTAGRGGRDTAGLCGPRRAPPLVRPPDQVRAGRAAHSDFVPTQCPGKELRKHIERKGCISIRP